MARCARCGEVLDEGARFCAECGAPVERAEAAAPQGEGTAATADVDRTAALPECPPAHVGGATAQADRTPRRAPSTGGDVPQADRTAVIPGRETARGGVRPVTEPVAVGSGATRHMPPVARPVARGAGSAQPVTYSARNTVTRTRIPLVVGLLVSAALVAGGAYLAVTVANRDADAPATASGTGFLPGEGADDAPAPVQAAPEPQEERTPKTAERIAGSQEAASLASFYGQLPALDAKVSQAAQDFNGLYISGSLEERRGALASCEQLRDDIAEARDEVAALGIPDDSPYLACADDIETLFEDLYQRIDVIVRSWEIDVGFEDPAGHGDEICAPMAEANVGGVNRYLKDYQERYPGADPAKVG